jgi:hypothetical protein
LRFRDDVVRWAHNVIERADDRGGRAQSGERQKLRHGTWIAAAVAAGNLPAPRRSGAVAPRAERWPSPPEPAPDRYRGSMKRAVAGIGDRWN